MESQVELGEEKKQHLFAEPNGSCGRCGGLTVPTRYMDVLDDTGEVDFIGERCIQCGEVVDPIIRGNRLRASVVHAELVRRVA